MHFLAQALHIIFNKKSENKIKGNGTDKRVDNGIVYKSYTIHYQPALDMQLDLI
jgi:hypothetical protein